MSNAPQIFSLDISDIGTAAMEAFFLEQMPVEKRERMKRYRKAEDRQRTFYGEILVRSLAFLKGLEWEKQKIEKNRYGKPYLVGAVPFCFNVSHSGQYVVCAISNEEIGIDIEEIKNIDVTLFADFFTEEEYCFICAKECSMQEQLKRFYQMWTLKEAAVKCIGTGITNDMKQHGFQIINESEEMRWTKGKEFYFYQDLYQKKYWLSLCYKSATDVTQIATKKFQIAELYQLVQEAQKRSL